MIAGRRACSRAGCPPPACDAGGAARCAAVDLPARRPEAAAIWTPYGVVVDAVSPCGAGSERHAARLTVAIVTARDPRVGTGWRGALGAITFDAGGSAASTITIDLTAIRLFIRDTHVLGADESRWPEGLRDRSLGRVVGRVLAHEIGHYVLQTPRHSASGLMRSAHTAGALVEPSRRGFELSADEASWLARNGDRESDKEKGPASADPEPYTRMKR